MKTRLILPLLLLFLTIASCGGNDPIMPPTPPAPTPGDSTVVPDTTGKDTLPDVKPEDFARGADISWYSQMEDEGKKFYSWNHRDPMDCPAVMQDLGLNAIALRVLVNPHDGYCAMDDVLRKARRVHQLGLDLLVSLHFSDTIASSSLQRTPQEWQDHSMEMLAEDVRSHTASVLQALTEEGIEPRWIQIGNQLDNGLLWPAGYLTRYPTQYATLVSSACRSARTICPKAQIIVAAGNPLNQPSLCAALDGLRTTDYDQIGLALYPTQSVGSSFQLLNTAISYGIENENDAIAYTMQTIDMLLNKYKKHCMIVECGVPVSQETAGSMHMRQLVKEARANTTCRGIIYHEPEAYEGWRGYTQGAFLSNGRPTQIIDALTK